MPSIFISHTSFDKPFVEKLAQDLIRLGVKVWFDKWEIKPGESLMWKIEEGIRANEFFGIVLSPQALMSDWVRNELSAAWTKQLDSKKIIILPILYRQCDLPLFLKGIKYANFKDDYDAGLSELVEVFDIKNTELICVSNWRKFKYSSSSAWKKFRENEFGLLVTRLVDVALEYNWSSWVGGAKLPYSICLRAYVSSPYFRPIEY